MGRDVALLARARETGEAVFSIYEWARPTLSFGRNQLARDHYDPAAIRNAGFDVVRRPTGGRALLHHREVTYSVAARAASSSLRDSYDRINRILLHGLSALGVNAEIASTGNTSPPGPVPCFADPAPGELIAGGRKLVGSAQWREDGALLQHGSILVDNDQVVIPSLMTSNHREEVPPAAATLSSILGRQVGAAEVASGVFAAVRELEDESAEPLEEEEVRADALSQARSFENELWTWRR